MGRQHIAPHKGGGCALAIGRARAQTTVTMSADAPIVLSDDDEPPAPPASTPSPEAIVRRVLAAGRRDDALYVRGADSSSGSSSEADSDPDYEETPKLRRQAAQQPPRQQPSRRIVNTGVSVVDAIFARMELTTTAMPAEKRSIDDLTTDVDSSEPESDDRPSSPQFSALCRCLEALEWGPKKGGPLPSPDLRRAILRRFFSLHLPAARASHAHLLLLLLPSEDPRRYHLGPTRLAAAVARALGLPAALKEHLAYADCRGEDFGAAIQHDVRAHGAHVGALEKNREHALALDRRGEFEAQRILVDDLAQPGAKRCIDDPRSAGNLVVQIDAVARHRLRACARTNAEGCAVGAS